MIVMITSMVFLILTRRKTRSPESCLKSPERRVPGATNPEVRV